eukprot:jgi/Chlat1/6633/Chrsp482S06111
MASGVGQLVTPVTVSVAAPTCCVKRRHTQAGAAQTGGLAAARAGLRVSAPLLQSLSCKHELVWLQRRRKCGELPLDGSVRCEAQATTTEASPSPSGAPPMTTSNAPQQEDIRALPVAENTISIRGRSKDRLKFEIEYSLKRGTTDNQYVIRGANGTALIDVPDGMFGQAFLQRLKDTVGLASINHIILGHYSPKRAETLKLLAEALPGPVDVRCSNVAAKLVRDTLPAELVDSKFKMTIVKGQPSDALDLGGGHELRFVLTPTPRWPEGMVTYDPRTGILYTHKLFSAHVCPEETDDEGLGWDTYGEDWRYFYDCMLAPTAVQAAAALEKLALKVDPDPPSHTELRGIDLVVADAKFLWSAVAKLLPRAQSTPQNKPAVLASRGKDDIIVSALAPLHGPVIRSAVTELLRAYGQWTAAQAAAANDATVAVIYASAYGNTSALAQAISRGLIKAGVGVQTLNCEMSTSSEVAAVVARSEGFVIGSPTLGGHMPTPVQEALGAILKDESARNKPCGVFGSFGWSGEAVDELQSRLKDAGFGFAFDPIRVKFKPTEQSLQLCEESGTDLAQAVLKAKKKKGSAPKYTAATDTEQAVGRIVGALCVLTAHDGDAESGMLASWVSQASFQPPGLTVAVAKDRAVENLVQPGASFVLNVLGEGRTKEVMKVLLKPFKPAQDRFEGLEVKRSEKSGAVIIPTAVSFLECTVQQRMETGDHWVIYATVDSGKLLDEKALTAVHYRKSGSTY